MNWIKRTAVYPTWIVAIWVGLLALHVAMLIMNFPEEYPRPLNVAMIVVFAGLILLEVNLRRTRGRHRD